jgi:PleD family two-component response regulator
LRSADLVAQPDSGELLVALPNTKTTDARVVEERLRQAVSKAAIGTASRRQDEMVEGLLKRARSLAWRVVENPESTTS